VGPTSTREALLEQGALLFARHGVGGVSARQLHEAVGARNESALQYHFGDKQGLVTEILTGHLDAIEARRAVLVASIAADGREDDVRALVYALAAPMADDLPSPLGRAHLRLVAQLSHPSLAYEVPFRVREAPAGASVVGWLRSALAALPERVRRERLAALRAQLISLFGLRAQLLDEQPARDHRATDEVFVQNLLDMLVAGLDTPPSDDTLRATRRRGAAPQRSL
jgi:AcrR family transcriptional regulator